MSRNGHFRLRGDRQMGTAYAPAAERSAEGDILYGNGLRGLREDDAQMRLGVSAYDISGLREDDADVRLGVSAYDLSGMREDDANVRLGMPPAPTWPVVNTRWDGATGRAEGDAEGHRVAQMGQPGTLVSNGRVGGMVEDHWRVRMGVSAYDLSGLREDDADVRLGVSAYDMAGLREDDASVRLGDSPVDDRYGSKYGPEYGMGAGPYGSEYGPEYRGEYGSEYRSDEYNVPTDPALRGLREDDASVRLGDTHEEELDEEYATEDPSDLAGRHMGVSAYDGDVFGRMGTAYAPDAQGAAEGDQSWTQHMGVSAYDLGVSAYDLGDVDSMSAEAFRIEQEQTVADHELGREKGYRIRMTANNAAKRAYGQARAGKIRSMEEAEQYVREAVMKRVARFQEKARAASEIANDAIANAMQKHGPKIQKALARKTTVSGVRVGYILRGLREDDADLRLMGLREDDAAVRLGVSAYDLARARAFRPDLSGAEEFPPHLLAAEGFHERFPVRVDIAGLGVIRGSIRGAHIDGLFDFLKASPSSSEYLATLAELKTAWTKTRARLMGLPAQPQKAIMDEMVRMESDVPRYDRATTLYIAEGAAGMTSSRVSRVQRLVTALPTIDKMIAQAETFGPAPSPAQEQQRTNETAKQDVQQRLETVQAQKAADSDLTLPLVAGGGAAALLTALVLALA